MGKSATVTVTLDRSKVKGQMGTTIKVNAAGLSEEITISAEEKPQRSFDVNPQSLTVGVNDKASFSVSQAQNTSHQQSGQKIHVFHAILHFIFNYNLRNLFGFKCNRSK